jgi:DNA-binding NarL/FixJ family response regulator
MPPPEIRARIVLADDHTILREGLRHVLESVPGYRVVGQTANGRDAVRLARELHPDLLILDVAMPGASGFDALRSLADEPNPVRTLLLTASIDRAGMVTALQLGARGVVLKTSGTDIVLEAIEAVLRGQHWVDRNTVADLAAAVGQMGTGARQPARRFGLTSRQLEIVELVAAGLTNAEIAKKLHISEHTVKHHVTQVFNKTGVSARLELALLATQHGLIDPR